MTQFYQLTIEKAIEQYKLGWLNAPGLLFDYIQVRFKPEWKIILNPKKVSTELGISLSTFYRAIAKVKEVIGRNIIIRHEIEIKSINEPILDSANEIREPAKQIRKVENEIRRPAKIDPQTTNKINNSSDSPYIRSNKDHISLSERVEKLPKEERENFLLFANQKVEELPKRPTLPKKWIAANLDDLYSEWKKSSAPVVQKAAKDKQFAEWYDLMRQLGHVTGQRVENGVQLVQMIGGGWIEYERKAKSWTLEYLRKCVADR